MRAYYNMTNKANNDKAIMKRQAREMLEKERKIIETQIVMGMMAATLLVLHDKWHYSAYTLEKVKQQIMEQFDAVNGKYVTIEDFYRELEAMGVSVC